MVREAMSHLEAAVTELETRMSTQQIDPKIATDLIARFHRIEQKVTSLESRLESGSKTGSAKGPGVS